MTPLSPILPVLALALAAVGCATHTGAVTNGAPTPASATSASALPRPNWPAAPVTTLTVDLAADEAGVKNLCDVLAASLGDRAAVAPAPMFPRGRISIGVPLTSADPAEAANVALRDAHVSATVSRLRVNLSDPSLPNPLKNGFAKARAAGRPLVLKFEAEWCAPCKAMSTQTLAQPDVKALLADRFVFKEIDVDYEPSTAWRLGVGPIPDLRVFDGEGNELARNVGAIGPDALMALLNRLAGE